MKRFTEDEVKNIKVDFEVIDDIRCHGDNIVRKLPDGAECIGTFYEDTPGYTRTVGYYNYNDKIYSEVLSFRSWSLD